MLQKIIHILYSLKYYISKNQLSIKILYFNVYFFVFFKRFLLNSKSFICNLLKSRISYYLADFMNI